LSFVQNALVYTNKHFTLYYTANQ